MTFNSVQWTSISGETKTRRNNKLHAAPFLLKEEPKKKTEKKNYYMIQKVRIRLSLQISKLALKILKLILVPEET